MKFMTGIFIVWLMAVCPAAAQGVNFANSWPDIEQTIPLAPREVPSFNPDCSTCMIPKVWGNGPVPGTSLDFLCDTYPQFCAPGGSGYGTLLGSGGSAYGGGQTNVIQFLTVSIQNITDQSVVFYVEGPAGWEEVTLPSGETRTLYRLGSSAKARLKVNGLTVEDELTVGESYYLLSTGTTYAFQRASFRSILSGGDP